VEDEGVRAARPADRQLGASCARWTSARGARSSSSFVLVAVLPPARPLRAGPPSRSGAPGQGARSASSEGSASSGEAASSTSRSGLRACAAWRDRRRDLGLRRPRPGALVCDRGSRGRLPRGEGSRGREAAPPGARTEKAPEAGPEGRARHALVPPAWPGRAHPAREDAPAADAAKQPHDLAVALVVGHPPRAPAGARSARSSSSRGRGKRAPSTCSPPRAHPRPRGTAPRGVGGRGEPLPVPRTWPTPRHRAPSPAPRLDSGGAARDRAKLRRRSAFAWIERKPRPPHARRGASSRSRGSGSSPSTRYYPQRELAPTCSATWGLDNTGIGRIEYASSARSAVRSRPRSSCTRPRRPARRRDRAAARRTVDGRARPPRAIQYVADASSSARWPNAGGPRAW